MEMKIGIFMYEVLLYNISIYYVIFFLFSLPYFNVFPLKSFSVSIMISIIDIVMPRHFY